MPILADGLLHDVDAELPKDARVIFAYKVFPCFWFLADMIRPHFETGDLSLGETTVEEFARVFEGEVGVCFVFTVVDRLEFFNFKVGMITEFRDEGSTA